MEDIYENDNVLSGWTKDMKLLDYMNDYQLLKMDYTPWNQLVVSTKATDINKSTC
jgi:hypothetical protein